MRPADDQVFITLCSQTFALKASLRAAYQLNHKYKGFGNLAKAISEGSFTAYQDVIKAGCTDPAALQVFLKPFRDSDALVTPLGASILTNREELLEFVLILSGGARRDDEPPRTGKPVTLEEFHQILFKLGTGWLGWSPDDAWDATPNEIMEAAGGRREMLAAIFGSGKRDEGETIDTKDANARAELNALGDLSVTTMSQARQCR